MKRNFNLIVESGIIFSFPFKSLLWKILTNQVDTFESEKSIKKVVWNWFE